MKKLIYLVCALLSLNAFSAKDKPKVSLKKLEKTVLKKSLFYPVMIKSKVDSKILSDGNYIVINRLVELGQKVKKGTPLLVLRNQDMSVHYEKRILKAPVDGIVASLMVTDGKFINKGDTLVHINEPNKLYGQIEVSAGDYKRLRQGLSGKIDISSLHLKDIPIEVKGIGAVVNSLTGTIAVELEIKEKMQELVPGVIGLAEITLNKEELALVQEKALYYIGEEVFLATLIENKVKKVKVKLGQRHKDKIEITSGLELGKSFISDSPKFLRDNEEVEITKKQ